MSAADIVATRWTLTNIIPHLRHMCARHVLSNLSTGFLHTCGPLLGLRKSRLPQLGHLTKPHRRRIRGSGRTRMQR